MWGPSRAQGFWVSNFTVELGVSGLGFLCRFWSRGICLKDAGQHPQDLSSCFACSGGIILHAVASIKNTRSYSSCSCHPSDPESRKQYTLCPIKLGTEILHSNPLLLCSSCCCLHTHGNYCFDWLRVVQLRGKGFSRGHTRRFLESFEWMWMTSGSFR